MIHVLSSSALLPALFTSLFSRQGRTLWLALWLRLLALLVRLALVHLLLAVTACCAQHQFHQAHVGVDQVLTVLVRVWIEDGLAVATALRLVSSYRIILSYSKPRCSIFLPPALVTGPAFLFPFLVTGWTAALSRSILIIVVGSDLPQSGSIVGGFPQHLGDLSFQDAT